MSSANQDGTFETDNKPTVTPETKFRRGGFTPSAEVTDDIPQAAAEGSEPGLSAEDQALVTEVGTEARELPFQAAAEAEGERAEEAPPTEEQPEPAKFKIGTREFTNQKEAWAYAEELEQERIAADAFRQGVEAASKLPGGNPAPVPQAPAEPEEIDPEYYTNPKAYFAKREAQIIEAAAAKVKSEEARRATHDATWNQFYKDYPDLVGAEDFVTMQLNNNWNTLQHVETKQALKQLAEKTRAALKPIIEARLPKTALARVSTAASPGSGSQVTSPKTEAKALSFVEQMKNNKKGRAKI